MGAWGFGPFENDEALDWAWTLESDADGSALREVLEPVVRSGLRGEYVDEWELPVAGAEVVAAARRAGLAKLPEEVVVWVREHGNVVGDDLVQLARAAVARIQDELAPDWRSPETLSTIADLADRLGQIAL